MSVPLSRARPPSAQGRRGGYLHRAVLDAGPARIGVAVGQGQRPPVTCNASCPSAPSWHTVLLPVSQKLCAGAKWIKSLSVFSDLSVVLRIVTNGDRVAPITNRDRIVAIARHDGVDATSRRNPVVAVTALDRVIPVAQGNRVAAIARR